MKASMSLLVVCNLAYEGKDTAITQLLGQPFLYYKKIIMILKVKKPSLGD
jgi:hypothetical protein